MTGFCHKSFLGQYLVSAKLIAFHSGVQDKLYETYKTDLSKKRDFDNEILRWQTKWSHSTDEKQLTLTETLHSPDNASVNCYPPTIFQHDAQSEDVLTFHGLPRWKQSDWHHLPWCMLTDIPIDLEAVIREFCAKKNRRLAFEFLWPPPRFWICLQLMCVASQVITLLLLLTTTTTAP